ncbi:cystathionine beta-lyase [Sinobaca qinghaiensis]|uniref:homocysteine desulfhydrase n=1 Tax=Sinobaca qinghaiensis TaxID=342944 RepID=A0A419V8H6_9BACL|nr:aminotransferase class I/II-fold pyridoxal phosphate-dependent enzyme [Sinobaca qinghaiensis]RKD76357.1 cystathionine beta-lyase [Sinobaca qinghaiensis]
MNYSDEEICMGALTEEGSTYGEVTPPIYQSTIFTKSSFETFTKEQSEEDQHFVYSRGTNPTVQVLEKKLAMLERAEACKCFGSGMGAISAVWMTLLKAGDHVLFMNNIYGPTLQLAAHMERFGIEYTVFDHEQGRAVEEGIKENTRLIYLESPGTMKMKVVDIKHITDAAKKRGIYTMMDNTWATPLFQKPMTLGVDIVIHSLTKYIGGHSDVVGGAVISSHALIKQLFFSGYQLFGSVLQADSAAMIIRGLRTLPLRMKQHQDNALQVISYLESRPEVKAVHHPAADKQNRVLIEQQLQGYAGLLSFELEDAGFEKVAAFINHLTLFRIGTSWGGYESLVNSPLKKDNHEQLKAQGFDLGMIRLSVGLEGAAMQIKDLEKGFQAVTAY